ncbi:MarR family winged helix-turn-helix transcriptional regulator [Finegoldia magna]|uniref:MarR family winged helix-turn-helix transcriptional regulator n=1 Tax=Finegoldia magna TaxID=1260 RepID=UPI000B91A9F1|nr:MarR family transcriptional regulator [Finegoldia magna]MBS5360064.1 MarR family transcriptional regulator [Finegoldia magna]MBS5970957.1 MarR family transcriptional regulator [Finegoldia magna]MDU2024472.1 MarR family transcriptional regulator [Finegoldia magna]MDU5700277.1 MarR family transcriptional regulator [Finegoldia magna]OXZ32449.1 hypothetical protein B9N54_07870 [Finegoldia magna]
MELKQFSNALHKLRCVEQNLTKEFENSTGFSLTRYEILIYLDEKKQSLQTEIAEHIGIDPAAITRQLKILEKEGFVTRDRNADNAREIIVTLTDYAKSELKICKQNHKDNPCNVAVSISKREIEELMEILESIEEKLQ